MRGACLFNSKNFAGSATLAEVCAQLRAALLVDEFKSTRHQQYSSHSFRSKFQTTRLILEQSSTGRKTHGGSVLLVKSDRLVVAVHELLGRTRSFCFADWSIQTDLFNARDRDTRPSTVVTLARPLFAYLNNIRCPVLEINLPSLFVSLMLQLIEMRNLEWFFDDRQNWDLRCTSFDRELSALDWNCIMILCTVVLFYV